ncbi:extracellular calcium-sensing receptor-like [Rhinatrema bivittatum]|uniref:extracellular calcium-sensing receptor-like n=1 Tax=Rhinatrema bivittatum TaxID=194408 RepID=UPI001125E5DA|nr:extracellular calcium-sensing receptor-like [Rhinatrema bivittatum]
MAHTCFNSRLQFVKMRLPVLVVLLSMPIPFCPADARGCTLRSWGEAGYAQVRDITIGGIFPVHNWMESEMSFTEYPKPIICHEFSENCYHWALALVFAIDEINHDQTILPNVSLGFLIYDSCLALERALRATFWSLTGKGAHVPNYQCQDPSRLAAIIGDASSSQSMSMASLLGLYRYPQVSYSASSPLLSDKTKFPSFLRTIPSDTIQARGLAQLVLYFGWTWVGILSTEDAYGEMGAQIIKEELLRLGACIAFHETIPVVPSTKKNNHIIDVVLRSSTNAIVLFSCDPYMQPILAGLLRQNVTGKVWIASEAWSTSPRVSTKQLASFLSGSIGFSIYEGKMPGFKKFLLKINPSTSYEDIFVRQFWEVAFKCQWPNPEENQTIVNRDIGVTREPCTGAEKMENYNNPYFGESNLRASYNVYTAVYSIAYALQDMHACIPGEGPFTNNTCADIWNFKPWQLLYYMKKVHFRTKMGEEMYFDSSGNPPAVYDIVNWHLQSDGTIHYAKVGRFDWRALRGELQINVSAIQWNMQSIKVPRSVCSVSCHPGYRKATQKGQPLCCFDCIPCAEGEISNKTDSSNCWPCPSDQWPNERRSECVPKRIEFLSYQEALGTILTIVSITCSITTAAILFIFVKYRDTPITKANNRELSFLLLGSLVLSFLCSLLFIGDPQPTTCLLRQITFGIIFVLCVSCVLAKTIMVVIAFNATKPNSNLRGWLGLRVPIVIVSASTLLQVLICATWLLLCPPFPEKNMKLKTGIIIWQCNECSHVAFWCMLGYMGLLACASFLVAFLARKLPDSFNEAKWITFSMLVFLSVWLSFIPGYLSTQGKDMVAVEVFGIISSSAGILICIFFPKCYIMLLRPDMNTREHLLGKGIGKKKKTK